MNIMMMINTKKDANDISKDKLYNAIDDGHFDLVLKYMEIV